MFIPLKIVLYGFYNKIILLGGLLYIGERLLMADGSNNINNNYNIKSRKNGTRKCDRLQAMGRVASQALHPSFYFSAMGYTPVFYLVKNPSYFKYGTISNFLSVFCEILNYFLASRMYLIKSSTVAPTPG